MHLEIAKAFIEHPTLFLQVNKGREREKGNTKKIDVLIEHVFLSAVEQNHGMISDDNDTKKKSRKGSIKVKLNRDTEKMRLKLISTSNKFIESV